MGFIVNMACGLANRMFQYSYYLFIKKAGYKVTVDFYRSAKLAHEKVAWNSIFPYAEIKQASRLKVFLWGRRIRSLFQSTSQVFPFVYECKNYYRSF